MGRKAQTLLDQGVECCAESTRPRGPVYGFWFKFASSNLLANNSKSPENNFEMQYVCKAILIMQSMQEWWGLIWNSDECYETRLKTMMNECRKHANYRHINSPKLSLCLSSSKWEDIAEGEVWSRGLKIKA